MRIQYASDLHLEKVRNKQKFLKKPLLPSGDILILAGDIVWLSAIDQHKDFFDYCSNNYETVYWVPGNHEYYHEDIAARSATLHENIRSNVLLVNNIDLQNAGTQFIFTTLWSTIGLNQTEKILSRIADFKYIKHGDGNLSIEQYNQLHIHCKTFLKETVQKPFDGDRIIATHYVPTLKNYPGKYLKSGLQEAFAIEMEDFIVEMTNQNVHCPYWIYGHHHYNVPDFTISNTTLTTNQMLKGFSSDKTIIL